MTAVEWLAWSAGAFERARSERKPVLLSIHAGWCPASLALDASGYAEPRTAALVNDRFVPIRVDADRRPDIAERYDLGGWPTTAFLNASGAVVGGGTAIDPRRLHDILARVLDTFASHAGRIEAARDDEIADPPPGDARTDVTELVYATFDAAHGGFGTAPKFPLVAPVRLALDRVAAGGDARDAGIAAATLEAMAWGGLVDEVDGGFFRCADLASWEHPRTEKLLEVNAALTHLYVEGAAVLEAERHLSRAQDTIRYVQTWLADVVDGGWGAFQAADDAFHALDADARAGVASPSVDRRRIAGGTGLMVSAALAASRACADTDLAAFAIRSLERLLLDAHRPGAGLAHDDGEDSVRGLLADHLMVAEACLDAFDAAGDIVHEMMAEELVRYAARTMWDEAAGGFFDREPVPDDERAGRMAQRRKPFAANAHASRLLRRLAEAAGEPELTLLADRILPVTAGMAPAHGPEAAHHELARRAARGGR